MGIGVVRCVDVCWDQAMARTGEVDGDEADAGGRQVGAHAVKGAGLWGEKEVRSG